MFGFFNHRDEQQIEIRERCLYLFALFELRTKVLFLFEERMSLCQHAALSLEPSLVSLLTSVQYLPQLMFIPQPSYLVGLVLLKRLSKMIADYFILASFN